MKRPCIAVLTRLRPPARATYIPSSPPRRGFCPAPRRNSRRTSRRRASPRAAPRTRASPPCPRETVPRTGTPCGTCTSHLPRCSPIVRRLRSRAHSGEHVFRPCSGRNSLPHSGQTPIRRSGIRPPGSATQPRHVMHSPSTTEAAFTSRWHLRHTALAPGSASGMSMPPACPVPHPPIAALPMTHTPSRRTCHPDRTT